MEETNGFRSDVYLLQKWKDLEILPPFAQECRIISKTFVTCPQESNTTGGLATSAGTRNQYATATLLQCGRMNRIEPLTFEEFGECKPKHACPAFRMHCIGVNKIPFCQHACFVYPEESLSRKMGEFDFPLAIEITAPLFGKTYSHIQIAFEL